ncbi:MAG TPA: hypothetical protein VGZ48_09370 [Candidatus Acidoferrales bacterium]|jgi:hypothetical protein|nr:hypothetical protein [Candidatus Acidoferrales bacterium]
MKHLVAAFLVLTFFAGPLQVAQERAQVVNIFQLLVMPEKYADKLVTVRGFLEIDIQPQHFGRAFLYVHQEDARNLLGNDIHVIPSEQMIKEEEKINRMYVLLTGVFKVRSVANAQVPETYIFVLEDVRNCTVWSNPDRPIGDSKNGG